MGDDSNPWQRLDSRQLYDNPWIRVREDRVLAPSGRPGIYGLVQFKNRAIGIIPVDGDGNTWLVGQYRYALEAYSWEIPMGGSPLEEEPLTGAKRELKEETGLSASDWREIMRLHTSNSVTDEVGLVYLAQKLRQSEWEPGETEELRLWKLPLTDAVDMALRGEITDAISVAGLLKTALLRENIGLADGSSGKAPSLPA